LCADNHGAQHTSCRPSQDIGFTSYHWYKIMQYKKIKAILAGCASLLLLASCGSSDDDSSSSAFTGSAGDELDLSAYVAIGDSLTAGFADNTLYIDGQINSYPNIIANSFALAGGGEFTQPLVNDNLGGLVAGGAPIATPDGTADGFATRLVILDSTGAPGNQPATNPTPARTTDIAPGQAGLVNAEGPFNNLGVPGARIIELASPELAANPFYARFASNPGVSSVISDAVGEATRIPTFFTFWAGNNDALGFATSGGVGGLGTDDPAGPFDTQDITNPVIFENAFNGIMDTLAPADNTDIRGVVMNIPAIEDIPFFTTVPSNAIELDAAAAEAVSAGFAAYNGGIQSALDGGVITAEEAAARTISFSAGNNGVLILDEGLTDLSSLTLPNLRQATAGDSILLTSLGGIGVELDGNPQTTVGVSVPLGLSDDPDTVFDPASLFTPAVVTAADAAILTAAELELLENNIDAYNIIIEDRVAQDSRIALYDAAADLADVSDADGLSFGTSSISSEFVFGGAFSLDGVHPTATGYAVIANGIIDTINDEFNANLQSVDPNERTRIFFEFPEDTDLSAPLTP